MKHTQPPKQHFSLTPVARILSSAGDLFPPSYKFPSFIYNKFIFLEALWPSIQHQLPKQKVMRFPFVNAPSPDLPGYYHFDFRYNANSFLLTISCCTSEAQDKQSRLQKKNQHQLQSNVITPT